MNTEKKIDWNQFLPTAPLPDTGYKKFAVGQVWATYIDDHVPVVRRIFKLEGEYADCEILAGECTYSDFMAESSTAAKHSKLVYYPIETLDLGVEKFTPPTPRWLQVVERVMVKAREHLDAGRGDDFSQVFVPKEDYEALKEHFDYEPALYTAIGLIGVYPVNPDGATFSD